MSASAPNVRLPEFPSIDSGGLVHILRLSVRVRRLLQTVSRLPIVTNRSAFAYIRMPATFSGQASLRKSRDTSSPSLTPNKRMIRSPFTPAGSRTHSSAGLLWKKRHSPSWLQSNVPIGWPPGMTASISLQIIITSSLFSTLSPLCRTSIRRRREKSFASLSEFRCHICGDDNVWADLLTRWSIPNTIAVSSESLVYPPHSRTSIGLLTTPSVHLNTCTALRVLRQPSFLMTLAPSRARHPQSQNARRLRPHLDPG